MLGQFIKYDKFAQKTCDNFVFVILSNTTGSIFEGKISLSQFLTTQQVYNDNVFA